MGRGVEETQGWAPQVWSLDLFVLLAIFAFHNRNTYVESLGFNEINYTLLHQANKEICVSDQTWADTVWEGHPHSYAGNASYGQ